MLEEGIELFLEASEFPRAVEGGIKTEEGEYDVAFQTGEPLVRSFEVSPRAGRGLKLGAD